MNHLDENYLSAKECLDAFQSEVQKLAHKDHLILAIEQEKRIIVRKEFDIFPHDWNEEKNLWIIERVVKSLLWMVGGHRVYYAGPHSLFEKLQQVFSLTGKRAFDIAFMEKIYQKKWEWIECPASQIPEERSMQSVMNSAIHHKRIGLDLGGTHLKICALQDDAIVYSEIIPWSPKTNDDPHYHFQNIDHAIKEALFHLENDVDSLGISSAGIFVDNQVRVSALFLKVEKKQYASDVNHLFLQIQKSIESFVKHPIHLHVANDGDVTALSGAKQFHASCLLGLSLGTSEAAGYVNQNDQLTGWLNEFAFVPMNWHPKAAIDPWSLDSGTGASYLCQEGIVHLASRYHLSFDPTLTTSQKVQLIQQMAENDDEKAIGIFQTMGSYLADAIAYYGYFYDIKHVFIVGGITNGRGGDILLTACQKHIDAKKLDITIHSSSIENRQIGQAIMASYL